MGTNSVCLPARLNVDILQLKLLKAPIQAKTFKFLSWKTLNFAVNFSKYSGQIYLIYFLSTLFWKRGIFFFKENSRFSRSLTTSQSNLGKNSKSLCWGSDVLTSILYSILCVRFDFLDYFRIFRLFPIDVINSTPFDLFISSCWYDEILLVLLWNVTFCRSWIQLELFP